MEKWKSAVKVVRGKSLEPVIARSAGRATAIDFAGIGGTKTWIGAVKMPPGAVTGAHHHGRHEVAIYITGGHLEIRWATGSTIPPRSVPGISSISSPSCRTRNAT